MKRKADALSEGLEKWDYLVDGTQTPAQLGWVANINTGTATESTTDGMYRLQASTIFRKNYLYPDNGAASDVGLNADFASGLTVEWRAIYLFTGSGTVQSNLYIGDSNELIRCFYDRSLNRMDIRWTTTVRHISSAVISQWNIYKLVVLGNSADFYLNGVYQATITNTDSPASSTKYLRLDQRIADTGTLDVTYDYIRFRRGTDSTTSLFKSKIS